MPITFETRNNIGVFTTIGDVEFAEGKKTLEQGLKQIKSGETEHKLLFDLRKSTEDRTKEEMQGLADFVNQLLGSCLIALVVNHDLLKGMSNMFATYCELHGMHSRVFESLDDATSWLSQNND